MFSAQILPLEIATDQPARGEKPRCQTAFSLEPVCFLAQEQKDGLAGIFSEGCIPQFAATSGEDHPCVPVDQLAKRLLILVADKAS